jgi:hypothetical protein
MAEMFPEVPIMVKRVATSETIGGVCDHCGQQLAYGKPVHKLAPHCCGPHRRPHKRGSKNGPGNWVCTTCAKTLTDEK